MNPLTKIKLINELNEKEAHLGVKDSVSWHTVYKDSAWVFIGGLPYELSEGDVICVFSQYGEIANINLVRDKKTGKSKGFCFLCYEDQRSTILAVDNFNGIKIKGRTIRVDHVANYRPPKDSDDIDDITKMLREEGCAPKVPLPSDSESEEECAVPEKRKKDKKEKKKKKEKKMSRKDDKIDSSSTSPPVRVKKEKEDMAYEKYAGPRQDGPERDFRPYERDDFRRHRDNTDRETEGVRKRDEREGHWHRDRDRKQGRDRRDRDWDREGDRGRGDRDWDREGDRGRGDQDRERNGGRGFEKHKDNERHKRN